MKLKSSGFKITASALALFSGLCFNQLCFAEPALKEAIDDTWLKLSKLIGKSSKETHNHISLFFIQKTNTIKIMPAADNKAPNCYQVVLYDLSSNIIYFSDAPKRVSGTIPISKFLTSWKHGFSSPESGPNGVIHGHSDNNHQDIGDIVTLSHPVYDVKHQNISYTACSMEHKHRVFSDGQVIHNALIFIDPINPWPP
jgi:hypothetical protein